MIVSWIKRWNAQTYIGLILILLLLQTASISLKGAQEAGEDSFVILKALAESYGVSGHEIPVRRVVEAYLPAWAKPRVDPKGNLSVTAGSGKTHVVFIAHMDEIGYVANAINDDGEVTVINRGGFYHYLLEGHPVLVHTKKGRVNGLVAPRVKYETDTGRVIPIGDVRIYLGTETKQETQALGIAVGDSITIPKKFTVLANNRATARSLDDRNGCAALLLAIRRLDPGTLKKKVTFAWSVEEEIGLQGAKVLAEEIKADYVFAVDTFVSSDSPRESKRYAHAPLGAGAVIRAIDNSNIAPRPMVQKLLQIGKLRNIPLQYGVTSGGNDGAVFTRKGAIDIPLSWPLRYSHSPAEVIEKTDLDALADIIHAIVEEF